MPTMFCDETRALIAPSRCDWLTKSVYRCQGRFPIHFRSWLSGTGLCSYRVRGVDGSCAKRRILYGRYAANIHTYYWYSITPHSFIPGLKPSCSANPSHRSLCLFSSGLTTWIPRTVYWHFWAYLFLFVSFFRFPLFSCWFRAED